jgi:hypothetical protein
MKYISMSSVPTLASDGRLRAETGKRGGGLEHGLVMTAILPDHQSSQKRAHGVQALEQSYEARDPNHPYHSCDLSELGAWPSREMRQVQQEPGALPSAAEPSVLWSITRSITTSTTLKNTTDIVKDAETGQRETDEEVKAIPGRPKIHLGAQAGQLGDALEKENSWRKEK